MENVAQDMRDPATGAVRNPGLHGMLCPANGRDPAVEICCDACDFFLVCFPQWGEPEGKL